MQITAKKLIDALRLKGLKISSAESCTGGLIAKRITDVPGASDVYEASVVTYSNRIKTLLLGVDDSILASKGAVCAETAQSMAKGLCRLTGADVCIATTGIAGPGGGTPTKPVGLVYMAVYVKPTDALKVTELRLNGTRATVRSQTVQKAFETAFEMIKEV